MLEKKKPTKTEAFLGLFFSGPVHLPTVLVMIGVGVIFFVAMVWLFVTLLG